MHFSWWSVEEMPAGYSMPLEGWGALQESNKRPFTARHGNVTACFRTFGVFSASDHAGRWSVLRAGLQQRQRAWTEYALLC